MLRSEGRRQDESQALCAERLGIDAAAGRRFTAEQRRCLAGLAAALGKGLPIAETRLSDGYAALRLDDAGSVVVLEPASPGVPSLFQERGVAVRYNGSLTRKLKTCLERVRRHLARGAAQGPAGRREDERAPAREPKSSLRAQLMAMNGALASLPHDRGARRIAELLWDDTTVVKLGRACNLSCVYCSVGSDDALLEPEGSVRRLLDAASARGARNLAYLGGEPSIHPRFFDIARYAVSRGFRRQVLVTNGLRLADARFAARVFASGIGVVNLSLDVFDEPLQEKLFGGRGGYRAVLEGLRRALEAPGVEVVVSAVVTALNAAHLTAYMEKVARLQLLHRKPIGVLLLAMQRPATSPEAQRGLPVMLLKAAARVRAALDRARGLGVSALTCNFPPCLLEGHELSALELYACEWLVDLGTGRAERSTLGGATTFWDSCAACPHAGYCRGVLSQYADEDVRAFIAARRAKGPRLRTPAGTAAAPRRPGPRG